MTIKNDRRLTPGLEQISGIPATAGIHHGRMSLCWTPAFAGDRLPIAFFIAWLFLMFANAAWADQDGLLIRFDASDPAQVNDGYYLYQEHCAACHGENLEGQEDWQMAALDGLSLAPPHDDSGHSWHHADDELFEMTKYGFDLLMGWEEGTSAMIGYADILSDEEIIAVLAFIKSSWSPQSLEWQTMVDKGYRSGWQAFSGLPKPTDPTKTSD